MMPVWIDRIWDIADKSNLEVTKEYIMEENKVLINTIDEYISQFSPEVQKILLEVRDVIKKAAPEATERISWQMPTFYLDGNLVHFAAHKNHLGFYPGAEAVEVFKNEIAEYKSSKGAIQFPYSKPMPFGLITKITKYRVIENKKWAEEKKKKK
jgi:uncharacterized protein YdhG (YjbR/CyaY superfamily)